MADSYKGLTIKFGGDTTNLDRALSNVKRTAQQADSALRRVNQALRFDPSNVQASALKFDLLQTKSAQATAKLQLLNQAMKDLSNRRQDLAGKSLGELIEEATKGKQEYNQLNTELAETKNKISAITGEKFPKENVDQYLSSIKGLDPELDKLIRDYERLHTARANFDTDLSFGDAEKMVELRTQISRTTAETEKLSREMKQMVAESAGIDRIGNNFIELKNSAQQATQSADQLEKELHQLDNALKLDPSSVQTAAMRIENLRQQSESAENKITILKNRMEQLRTAAGTEKISAALKNVSSDALQAERSYDKATAAVKKMEGAVINLRNEQKKAKVEKGEFSAAYRDLTEKVKAAEIELRELVTKQEQAKHAFQDAKLAQEYRQLNVELTETKAKLNSVNAEITEATGKMAMSTSSLTTLGLALYSTVTPAVTLASSLVIDSADRIDGAFRDMKKTVDGTAEQFEHLKQAAIEYSNTHVTSADQILEIESLGGQLGIAVEALEEFSTVVSNLDIATNMETETIAEDLGSLSNVMHMSTDDFSKFGDALVRLGNNMPTQESKIMNVTKRIASMGSIVGMTQPEILAWATAISATGQNAEAAGTAISTTFSNIETAVSSGGEKLEAFAAVAGVSAEEFANSWNNNPSQAVKDFVAGLRQIKTQGGSVDKTLQDLGITGVRQKQALMGLTQTYDVLNDALIMSQDAWDGVNDAWGKAGDAAREAQQKSEGFSGALQILKNIAENFGAAAGESLTEPLKALSDIILNVAKAFEGLPPEMQTFLTMAVGTSAAIGPLLTLFAGFNTALTNIKGALTKQATAFVASYGGVMRYRDAISAGIAPMNAFASATEKAEKRNRRLMITAKAAGAAMSALKLAAVGVAVVLIGQVIDSISKEIEAEKNLEKATSNTANSYKAMSDSFDAASKDASDSIRAMSDIAVKSLDEVTEQTRETTKNQADLMDSLKESATELGRKLGFAERWAEEMYKLNDSNITTEEGAAKLKTAVSMVNDALGENYQVMKDEDGVYRVYKDDVELTTESLKKLVGATEAATKAEYYRQQMTNISNQAHDNEVALADARRAEKYAQEEYEAHKYSQDVMQYSNALKEAQSNVEELTRDQENLNNQTEAYEQLLTFLELAQGEEATALDLAMAKHKSLTDMMVNSGKNMGTLAEQFNNLGITEDQFSSLTDEELQKVVDSYDGSEESISLALARIGKGFENMDKIQTEAFNKLKQQMIDLGFSEEELANKTFDELENVRKSYENLGKGLGIELAEMKAKLDEYGVTQEQVASLTPEQVDKIIRAYQTGSEDIDTILKAIKDGTVDKLGTAGSAGGQAFADGIESKEDEAKSAAKGVGDAAKSELDKTSDKAYTSGQNFTIGFSQGISAKDYLVRSAASMVGILATKALAAAQQEGSPSKITRQSGKYFSQGFALGIKSDTQLAVDAAKTMGRESAAALRDEVDGFDSTFAVSTEHGYGAARAGNVYNSNPYDVTNIYIDGAIVNDDKQIGNVLKDTLLEYKRKKNM